MADFLWAAAFLLAPVPVAGVLVWLSDVALAWIYGGADALEDQHWTENRCMDCDRRIGPTVMLCAACVLKSAVANP